MTQIALRCEETHVLDDFDSCPWKYELSQGFPLQVDRDEKQERFCVIPTDSGDGAGS